MSPKTEQHSNRKGNMNKHPSKHDTSSKQKQTHKAKIKITFKQKKIMSPGPRGPGAQGPRGPGAGGILKDFCWFCWGPELSAEKSFQDAPSHPWGVPFKGALRALEILSRRPNKAFKKPFKCP